jgi:hypothetical protein
MGIFRRKPASESGEVAVFTEREEQIVSHIRQLECFIEEAPDEIRRRMEEEMTMMPAPDDLEEIRRESKFFTQLSRGEIRNERRHQAGGAFLFILLATAIGTLSLWIYNFLQGMQ